jgi:hypothetical protein
MSMMELQKRARLATLPAVTDERAASFVSRQNLTARLVRDVLALACSVESSAPRGNG